MFAQMKRQIALFNAVRASPIHHHHASAQLNHPLIAALPLPRGTIRTEP